MRYSGLLPLLLSAFCSLHGFASEEEIICDFEYPRLSLDYWPVLEEDPAGSESGLPVVDIFVGRQGIPSGISVLRAESPQTKAILQQASQLLRFRPAFACGEPVEGFYRYPLTAYFYVPESEGENLSAYPSAAFVLEEKLASQFDIIGMVSSEKELHFRLTISPEGKVTKVEGLDSEWAENLADKTIGALSQYFSFNPGLKDSEPVESHVHLKVHMGQRLSGRILGVKQSGESKPMPGKPGERVRIGEPLSVQLSFYPDGSMENIQFLTVMSEEEAFAALSAFRRWQLDVEPSKDEEFNPIHRRIQYMYTEEDPTAVLLEEEPGYAVTPPKPVKQGAPRYPQELRKAGISGIVLLEFFVDENGKVRQPEVVVSSNKLLSKAAVNAVKRWRFKPATFDGDPVTTRVRIPVPFNFNR